MRFPFPIALLALLLSLAACKPPQAVVPVEPPKPAARGLEVVEKALPTLVQALRATVGETATEHLLARWSATDVTYFLIKNAALMREVRSASVPSVDRLFIRRGGAVISSFGEAFGTSYFGVLAEATGATFYDEIGYDAYNPYGRRPDGLFARIEGDTLVLLGVLESKLGSGGFDRGQAHDYLRQWKSASGITLPVNGVSRNFPPEQIVLGLPDGTTRPLAQVEDALLEAQTTIVVTRPHPDFRGTVLRLPFDSVMAGEAAMNWLTLLTQGRPIIPKHENFVVPVPESPEELEDYRLALQNWMLERGAWPKAGGETHLERLLAREISSRKGQARAFVEDLDDDAREELVRRGVVPSKFSFERRLLAMAPTDEGALSSVAAYRYAFEPGVDDASSLLVQALVTRSTYAERWRGHFDVSATPPPPPTCGEELENS